jgi:hypothetical protein
LAGAVAAAVAGEVAAAVAAAAPGLGTTTAEAAAFDVLAVVAGVDVTASGPALPARAEDGAGGAAAPTGALEPPQAARRRTEAAPISRRKHMPAR